MSIRICPFLVLSQAATSRIAGATVLKPLSSSSTTHGHHSGNLYRKQRNLVTNSFDADAEPHVEDDASA